ncbi:hypothetical protein [Ornithinimicrobium murale]|uniref:hypothetical protein n=1 Tax=Ornithinimicrobium murale TaxID=1050153 RepID=UPI0013B35E49|nr:hypothetical protein [Ornithinimicrobium murale]
MDEIGATARHKRALLDRVEAAAGELRCAEAQVQHAREIRDQAVRAAVGAGAHGGQVAAAAEISRGLVSRIVNAARG